MAQELFQGHVGFALLANSLATGAGLFVLIEVFGAISKAHFNPVVSLVEFLSKNITGKELVVLILAQFLGAYFGVLSTHLIFNHEIFEISSIHRSGFHLVISEFIATFGLLGTILILSKKNPAKISMAVSMYITSAYWFTSSTSFANPAVTFARMFTQSFGGMHPEYFIPFFLAQVSAGVLCWWGMKALK